MTDRSVPLTSEGKAKLEAELDDLRRRRREVAEMIHEAQGLGTSQNDAEYDDAKNEQGRVEGRILELEDILRRARPIETVAAAAGTGRVVLGSEIEVDQDGVVKRYRIVGGPEADPVNGKISHDSPVGVALLGKAVGDVIFVNVPRGAIKVTILRID